MRVTFEAFDELRDIDELEDSPYQTNTHTEESAIRLALIMKECGVDHPIEVVKGTNRICFGHLRKWAAKINGWKKYPVVYHTFKNEDEERVKVTSDNAMATWAQLDLSLVNKFMVDLGPDFNIDLLAVPNFLLEPQDKFLERDLDKDLLLTSNSEIAGQRYKVIFSMETETLQKNLLTILKIKKHTKFKAGHVVSVNWPQDDANE